MIVLAQKWTKSISSFLCVIMRNAWEQMMNNMEVNDVMQQVSQEVAGVPIHGTQSTTEKGP